MNSNRVYKMICTDLDGTLLDEDSQISRRNAEAIRKCLEQGIQVYFVTGRPYCFAKYHALLVDERIGVIANNGACYELDGKLISQEIDQGDIEAFIDLLKETGAHAFLKGNREFYTHEAYDRRFLYDHMNEQFRPDFRVHANTELSFEALYKEAVHILKILVYDMDSASLAVFRERVRRLLGLHVSSYNPISFEVTKTGVHKGTAIQKVQSQISIAKEEILSLGDSENDLPMFAVSGCRIVMENGKQKIRDAADFITASNREDGVAQALERYCIIGSNFL